MDSNFYLDINHFARHTPGLHGFMAAYATYGVGLFGLLILAGWWFARSQTDPPRAVTASLWAAVGTVVAVGINQPIVEAVHRVRPYYTHPGVEVLVARSHDFSFPSDHTITAGAAVAGLWIIARYGGRAARLLATVGTVLALFLAFARVYVGAHYPGDVTAGLLIGAAIVVSGWLILGRLGAAIITRLATVSLVRPLVFATPPAHAGRPASTQPAGAEGRAARSPRSLPTGERRPTRLREPKES